MGKFTRFIVTAALMSTSLLWRPIGAAQTGPSPSGRATAAPLPEVVADSKARPVDSANGTQAEATTGTMTRPPSPPTLLDPNIRPIDLNTALRLAGVQNPQLM